MKAAAFAFLLCAAWTPCRLQADETSSNIPIAKIIGDLKIGGDVRLRQENFWKSSRGQTDRSRQRFRFRLGIQPRIEDLTAGFRLASGTGEQVSTNQSFDDLGSLKAVWIDQAYLRWNPFEWLGLSGGKMPNPFWRIASSDLVFDDDWNPEGFSQQLERKLHPRVTGFTRLAQIVLDEDPGDNRDQWLFGCQIGAKTKIVGGLDWDVATAVYDFENERSGTFGQVASNEGNSRLPTPAPSTVTAFFTLFHLNSEARTRLWGYPLSLQADFVANVADARDGAMTHAGRVVGSSSTEKVGYHVGVVWGKAAAARTWEVAYFYKRLESNAVLADITDADFGDGGTNRRGHIFWVAFAPRDYLQLKIKALATEVIRPDLAPGPDNVNRMQADLLVKF